MDISAIILTAFGLCLFEVISSIDNAVVNADVLSTMSKKARGWFLFYGLLFAVFVVRGLLPLAIIWATNSSLGFVGALTATFSNNPIVKESIAASTPILLSGGGIFLLFLFLHWLFAESKEFGLFGERFFSRQSIWFFAAASVILTIIVWLSLNKNSYMTLGAVIGSTAFFITNGFKQNADIAEKHLMRNKTGMSDISKILYLEILDMTFSIDGVLGAFAFTLSVPLIILGNGLGALVVRQLTVRNIDVIKKYVFIKNGAMYSIFFLGVIMLLESFGVDIPTWIAPIMTFFIIGYFVWKSRSYIKKMERDIEKI